MPYLCQASLSARTAKHPTRLNRTYSKRGPSTAVEHVQQPLNGFHPKVVSMLFLQGLAAAASQEDLQERVKAFCSQCH